MNSDCVGAMVSKESVQTQKSTYVEASFEVHLVGWWHEIFIRQEIKVVGTILRLPCLRHILSDHREQGRRGWTRGSRLIYAGKNDGLIWEWCRS